jgi:glutamate dehydrogenase/leucine dehydrogenase
MFCREGGAIIIAIAMREGAILNPKGLDEEKVLQHRREHGSILDYPGATNLPRSTDALELDCDVLIPAALENQLTKENAPQIKARILLEGANGPTTPEAEEIFHEKGMMVIPDVYANAGGVTVSYFEFSASAVGSVSDAVGALDGKSSLGISHLRKSARECRSVATIKPTRKGASRASSCLPIA